MARPSRWDDVVASAAKVFRQHGFAQATLEEIADNLGMLKGSLYNYISTKEDLLTAVIRVPTERIVHEAGRIADSGDTSEQKVRALIALHIHVIVDIYDFAAVYLHEIAKSNLAEDWHARDREYIRLVEGVMATAVEDGTFRSDVHPHVAAMTMIGALNWLTKWWNPDGPVGSDEITQQISDSILGGLCANHPGSGHGQRATDGASMPAPRTDNSERSDSGRTLDDAGPQKEHHRPRCEIS